MQSADGGPAAGVPVAVGEGEGDGDGARVGDGVGASVEMGEADGGVVGLTVGSAVGVRAGEGELLGIWLRVVDTVVPPQAEIATVKTAAAISFFTRPSLPPGCGPTPRSDDTRPRRPPRGLSASGLIRVRGARRHWCRPAT